jgi:hypothetical protein
MPARVGEIYAAYVALRGASALTGGYKTETREFLPGWTAGDSVVYPSPSPQDYVEVSV